MEDTRLCWTPYLLRYLRMSRQWSLHDACVHWKAKYPEPHLKIAKNQILKYELHGSVPRSDRLAMLCELFGVDPSFLFTRSHQEMVDRMGDMYEEVMKSVKERGPTTPQKTKNAASDIYPETTRM